MRNNINTYADLTAYNADTNKDFPNISYIEGTAEVKWNKYDPDHIVCVYNVTSTSEPTTLFYEYWVSQMDKVFIDGVEQQTIQNTYTFDTTGEHIVKYKYKDSVPGSMLFRETNITSVVVPIAINKIGIQMFENCSKLTSIIIPNTITQINNSAFNNCYALKNITIPTSVTSIGESAFRYVGTTTKKATFTFESITPPTLVNNNMLTIGRTEAIYVPAESVEAYKTAQYWDNYESRIFAIPTT